MWLSDSARVSEIKYSRIPVKSQYDVRDLIVRHFSHVRSIKC